MQQELKLRQKIDAKLRLPLTDAEWTLLEEEGYVSDVVNDELELSAAINWIRKHRAAVPGAPASRLRGGRRSGGARTPKPRQDPCTRAIAALLAAEASQQEDVFDFRVIYVEGGDLLKQDEVLSWFDWYARQGDKPVGMWLTGVFVPPDERRKIEAALKHKYAGFDHDTDGNLLPFKVTVMVDPARIEQHVVFHEVRCAVRNPETGQDDVHTVKTRPNGVLDKLRQLSKDLAYDFGWDEAEATRFILTDVAPQFREMNGFFRPDPLHPTSARITLHIYPEVSPQEVAEYYRYARGLIMDTRPRELSEKHVQLACFVAKRPGNETWTQRMAAWNQEYPNWKYGEPSNFSRDCRKAREHLLSPKFHRPSAVASDGSSDGAEEQA